MNRFVLRSAVAVALAAAGLSAPAIRAHGGGQGADPEVLAVREGVWRAWFAGDEKALAEVLPPEFMAFGEDGTTFTDRATTIESSRKFKADGGRLVSLAFPETRAQRYGDTVILYGLYEAVMETGGQTHTMKGRLTEIFVRRNGKWLHPGWHLDGKP